LEKEESKLSLIETISLAVGFTIGSGIITQTGIGIGMTGRSIFLAFLVSAVLFLVSFRPIFMMSTLLPRTSAAYVYAKELIHEDVGRFYAYVYFLGRMTIAIFGISFAQYLAGMVPAFSGDIPQRLIALSVLTLFFIVNLFGIKAAAKLQNIMCVVLIAGILTFVACGIGKVDFAVYFAEGFFTGGFGGFYSAVSLLYFAVGGAYIITDFAPKIQNASRVMVKVIVGVTFVVCILYMLMGIVASGAVPVAEAAGKPLSVSAGAVLPGRALYGFFIIGACMGALITTLNSSFVWYSNSLIRPCEDGCFPKSWAKTNRAGVPWRLLVIFYLFGAVPAVLGMDLAVLSKMAIGLTILGTCIPMAGILKLPEKYPKLWKRSPYARRYPAWRLKVMVALTYAVLATQVYALFAGNPLWSNVVILVYMGAVIFGLAVRRVRIKNK
jgi:APA family basic amino acid/polyamine antiporter